MYPGGKEGWQAGEAMGMMKRAELARAAKARGGASCQCAHAKGRAGKSSLKVIEATRRHTRQTLCSDRVMGSCSAGGRRCGSVLRSIAPHSSGGAYRLIRVTSTARVG